MAQAGVLNTATQYILAASRASKRDVTGKLNSSVCKRNRPIISQKILQQTDILNRCVSRTSKHLCHPLPTHLGACDSAVDNSSAVQKSKSFREQLTQREELLRTAVPEGPSMSEEHHRRSCNKQISSIDVLVGQANTCACN